MRKRTPPQSRNRLGQFVVFALLLIAGAFPFLFARADDSSTEELPFEMKTTGPQAVDLIDDHGKKLDRDDASDLFKKGVDISKFDPAPNDTWTPTRLPYTNQDDFKYPPVGSQVLHEKRPDGLADEGGLTSTGMSRLQVTYNHRPFRLIVNMDNHEALMEAALLRTLGYPVDSPKWYKQLNVRFEKAEDMQTFMDDCTLETHFSCDRWLTAVDQKNLILSFKDVNLEYPRIVTQQLYDGIISNGWVDGRRAMRALLIPLILGDVRLSEDSVNLFPWEYGRILGENLMLSHPSVGAFAESTYEDFRWIGRRIGALSRDEIKAIVGVGQWPSDIAALLVEKIISRRDHLMQMLGLNREGFADLPFNDKITIGAVVNGKATQEYYPDYAARFTVGDPDSPMRWSELRHFVRMEGIAQGIQAIMSKVNDAIQIKDVSGGLDDHKQKLIDEIAQHFKDHPKDPYVMPLRPWAEPLLGFNVNASRSLVTGTYYGSDSNVQLVDNFSVGANVGAFGSIDGRTYLKNFAFGGSTGYMRTYTHVRPIASLSAVKNENWKNLFVPGFFRGTGKVLTWKQVKKHYDSFVAAFNQAQKEYLDALNLNQTQHDAWEKSHAALVTLNGGQPIDCPEAPKPATADDIRLLFSNTFGVTFPEKYEIPSPTAAPGTLLRQGFVDTVHSLVDLSQWTFEAKVKQFADGIDGYRKTYETDRQTFIARTNLWNAFAARFPDKHLSCDLEPKVPQAKDVTALFKSATGYDWPSDRTAPVLSSDPKNPTQVPDDLEDSLIVSTMKEFLSDLRDNEVYTITDSFVNTANAQVSIPLTTLVGSGVVDLIGQSFYDKISPAVGVSLTGQYAITKRLMILRKGDQIQVYDSKMKARAGTAAVDFTAWIELAKIAEKKKKGEADTDALMLDLSAITDSDKAIDPKYAKDRKKLLYAMADLFFKNEIDTATSYSPAFQLHHDMKGTTKSAKFLFWNWSTYAETHKVKVTPPADPLNRYDVDKEARFLFSARKMNLKGKNPYGLMGQILSKAVGINGLLDSGDNQNPSSTFLGVANWSQVRTEAETTDGHDFKPTVTFEDHYSGWFLAKEKLMKILDSMQAEVDALNLGSKIFRRSMFETTTQLQSYEIRSNVLLYPSGVDKLMTLLTKPTREELLKVLMDFMDPKDYGTLCNDFIKSQTDLEAKLKKAEESPDDFSDDDDTGRVYKPTNLWDACVQSWMRKVMRHMKKRPKNTSTQAGKEEYVTWLTDTMYLIDKHVQVSRFLSQIGRENFFLQAKVSGFRKGDESALNKDQQTDYITDTIGTIQQPVSLGAFRDFDVYSNGVKWNFSDYEFQARYFGEGL